ncbi:helix-turn-helix transcriptional regulator [Allocoleopsis sp.]|uniref:helix-turn-helix transcriptional regulator n=1 Tax=Allocoleopsis sp. TaxID=3088169 RepID=UPI002FD08956
MTSNQPHLKELADFLKSRRDRLTPAAVGLPSGTRRRTPGLRREEVAQLANVSTTWYTFLEQGRDIRVSTQVLESLAQALRLTSDERTHLFMLALQQLPPEIPHGKSAVSPAIQHMLDHLEFCPAYVTGYRFDILAWNQAACALFGDFSSMTTRERNKIWYFFTNAAYRQMLVDWEGHAQLILARFRSICGRYLGDAELIELAEDMQRVSPEFRQWWSQHEVQGQPKGFKAYEHPLVGRLEFEYSVFQVIEAPELTLVVYTPLPESGTVEQLQKLKTSIDIYG